MVCRCSLLRREHIEVCARSFGESLDVVGERLRKAHAPALLLGLNIVNNHPSPPKPTVQMDILALTWAPTLSNISVLVTPIYSRDSIKNFSMKKFVNGELNGKGSNEVGFI